MLLDISFYGFAKALKKAGVVLGYHVFSAAVVAGVTTLGVELGKLTVTHPEYGVYVASAVAGVNVLSVLVKTWLTSINPEKLMVVTPVVSEVLTEGPADLEPVS